jgi:hypothetical protein
MQCDLASSDQQYTITFSPSQLVAGKNKGKAIPVTGREGP